MKANPLTICLLLVAAWAVCQPKARAQAQHIDYVSLKSGGQLRGWVLGLRAGSLRVLTPTGDTVAHPLGQVHELARFPLADSLPNLPELWAKRWHTHTELGWGNGIGSVNSRFLSLRNRTEVFQLRVSQTYQVGSRLALGGGLGYDRLGAVSLVPLFAEARLGLAPKLKFAPFLLGRLGYAAGWGTDGQERDLGGGTWQVGLGVASALPKGQRVYAKLGYHVQYRPWQFANARGAIVHREMVAYEFVSLGLGFSW